MMTNTDDHHTGNKDLLLEHHHHQLQQQKKMQQQHQHQRQHEQEGHNANDDDNGYQLVDYCLPSSTKYQWKWLVILSLVIMSFVRSNKILPSSTLTLTATYSTTVEAAATARAVEAVEVAENDEEQRQQQEENENDEEGGGLDDTNSTTTDDDVDDNDGMTANSAADYSTETVTTTNATSVFDYDKVSPMLKRTLSSCEPIFDPTPITSTTGNNTHSNIATRRRLEFIHIPKTGGTTMEVVAHRNHVNWARSYHSFARYPLTHVSYWHMPIKYFQHQEHVPNWMKLTKEVDVLVENEYDDETRNTTTTTKVTKPSTTITQKTKTTTTTTTYVDFFTIVRNPYSRVVSEWNFLTPSKIHKARKKQKKIFLKQQRKHNRTYFNDEIQRILQETYDNRPPPIRPAAKSNENSNATSRESSSFPYEQYANWTKRQISRYFSDDAHDIPQVEYLDGIITDENRHTTNYHILQLEYLKYDFPCLINAYRLNDRDHLDYVRYLQKQHKRKNRNWKKHHRHDKNENEDKPKDYWKLPWANKRSDGPTTKDLNNETIAIINKLYKDDFVQFGYSMIQ